MIVMKFGGTSVQDKQAIERVISIVRSRLAERPVVVVSALAKVTRLLVSIALEAEKGHGVQAETLLDQLERRHIELAKELLPPSSTLLQDTLNDITSKCLSLAEYVRGISLIRELSDRSRARIVSQGELLSSCIVSAAMNAVGIRCQLLDARKMVKTNADYLAAEVNLSDTQANAGRLISEAFYKGTQIVLTQGFIASTSEGDTSLLGFEGSDYSAALFGLSIAAGRVEIWTDVDGIRTADPRIVLQTSRIERVSYEEAAAMARLGAKVLHPKTMGPARLGNVPIHVLNSLNPSGLGSVVGEYDNAPKGPKSLAYLPQIELVEVRGSASGLMRTLSEHKMEPLLIGQNEKGLTLSFEPGEWSKLYGQADSVCGDFAQFSVVGKDLLSGGLAPKILAAIADVRMMVAGTDGMSLSFVLPRAEAENIVNKVHELLFV